MLFSKKAKLIACPFSSKETAEKFIQVKPLNQVFIGSIDNLKDESMSYFKSNPEKKTLLIRIFFHLVGFLIRMSRF